MANNKVGSDFAPLGNAATGAVYVEVLSDSSGGGATLAEQQTQTENLVAIKEAVQAVGVHRYPSTDFYTAIINFTGALAGDTIRNKVTVDTNDNSIISDIWTNLRTGLALTSAPVIDTEVEYSAGTSITFAQMQSLGLAKESSLSALVFNLRQTLGFEIIPDGSKTSNSVYESASYLGLYSKAHIILNVTDIQGGTPSVLLRVEAQDIGSLDYYTLIESVVVTDVGMTILKIGSDYAPVPNLVCQDFLPENYRISVIHDDAQPITYSVGVNHAK
jgi:hypothetical protein